MSYADDVREHCRRKYIEAARQRREKTVQIRAGTVHKEMGYRNRLPLVCSALGAVVFEEVCGIKKVAVKGPHTGANTIFIFEMVP